MDLVRAVAFLLAAGAALAAALSLGGAVSDKLDLFAQIAPVWLVAGLLALLVLALNGGGRTGVALALFAVAVSAGLIAPDLIAGFAQLRVAPERQTIRIVQFNLWDRNRDPAATARWLRDEKADVLVLEELGDRSIPQMLTGDYPYQTSCMPDCATIILSRIPAVDSGVIAWPGLGPRHTGAWATLGKGPSAFTVAGTHYQWPVPVGPQQAQARQFAQSLAPFDHKSLIVAGDFNLNPWTFGLRRQDKTFGLTRVTHAIFTWPAGPISHWRLHLPFAILAVDHVYAGSDWKVVSVSRGPLLGSDHYPVIAVLTR